MNALSISDPSAPRPPRDRRVVVVVEDDEDDRLLFEEALDEVTRQSPEGFSVEYLEKGEALLPYLEEEASRLLAGGENECLWILLDLNLPGQSGWETLAELRAHERFSSVPVVIFTTSDNPEDQTRAIRNGAQGFLTKPAGFPELVQVCRLLREWVSLNRAPDFPHREGLR